MEVHVLAIGACRCDACRDQFAKQISTHAFREVFLRKLKRLTAKHPVVNGEQLDSYRIQYDATLAGARANFARN